MLKTSPHERGDILGEQEEIFGDIDLCKNSRIPHQRTHAKICGICKIGENDYFFDSNGVKISNKAAVYIGSSVYSFDADGIATKIEDSTEGIWVEFLTGGKGYFKNGFLYRDELLTIMEEEVEVYYYFDDHGVMVTDKKVEIDDVIYIFGLDGKGKKVTDEL